MIANHKGEIPVVILLIPFITGIAGGIYFNYPAAWLNYLLCALSCVFLFFNLYYSRLQIYKLRWLSGLLIYPVLFLSGYVAAIFHNELNQDQHFSKQPAHFLAVTINSEAKIKGDLVRFTAVVNRTISAGKAAQSSGNILITIKDELAKKLFYGEQIIIPAKYALVDPPFNPGEFDYKQYLANHNIHYQAFLFPKQYVIIKAGQGNPVIAYALQTRENLVRKLKANMRDTNAVAVASTLILGYKADLSNDVMQAYSKTGTIHILSVSGGHVAVFYLLLAWALSFLNVSQRKRLLKAVIIISLIWAYALLTGFSPAVCRAAVMISLVITGKTYSRYINSLNILAVSAFALLLYDPFLITDVGFQLSYLAVAGLVIFQPIIQNWLSFGNWFGKNIWTACSVSLAAQIITFPLSAYYFHQFPVYFLISNLLIALPVAIILYSGIALLLLPQIPVISKALGYILENTILIMNKGLSYIEHAPYASINKIWLSAFEYLMLYIIVLLAFYFIYYKRPWLVKAALVCTLVFSISIGVKRLKKDSVQSITFLNLRKHSGIVFKTGANGVIITDLPETDKNFQYGIQPGLDSNRILSYQVISMDSDFRSALLLKRGGFMQFLNKRLWLLNHNNLRMSIPKHFDIDYLFMANNGYLDTAALIRCKMLIIDASNTEKHIIQIVTIADRSNIKYYNLRRNKSITALSN